MNEILKDYKKIMEEMKEYLGEPYKYENKDKKIGIVSIIAIILWIYVLWCLWYNKQYSYLIGGIIGTFISIPIGYLSVINLRKKYKNIQAEADAIDLFRNDFYELIVKYNNKKNDTDNKLEAAQKRIKLISNENELVKTNTELMQKIKNQDKNYNLLNKEKEELQKKFEQYKNSNVPGYDYRFYNIPDIVNFNYKDNLDNAVKKFIDNIIEHKWYILFNPRYFCELKSYREIISANANYWNNIIEDKNCKDKENKIYNDQKEKHLPPFTAEKKSVLSRPSSNNNSNNQEINGRDEPPKPTGSRQKNTAKEYDAFGDR